MNAVETAAKRRGSNWPFIYGHAIDIGCGGNPIRQDLYPNLITVTKWDMEQGDGQVLQGVGSETFDCAHSSHSLEHMIDPIASMKRWVEVTKTGGYIVVTVPDEEMYERLQWPSKFNTDHKWSFSTFYKKRLPNTILVMELILSLSNVELAYLQRITENFDPNNVADQTTGNAECCIEFVLKKVN